MSALLPLSTNILVYVFVFLGVLLAYEGIQQLFFVKETRNEARNRRMRMIQQGSESEDILKLLRDPAISGPNNKIGPVARIRRTLLQAGIVISPFWVFLIAVLLGVVAFSVASNWFPPDIAMALSVAAAVFLPLFIVLALKQERTKKLTLQLPDALDLMARGLKVGHPVAITIGNVAKDMPDPIGSEFGLIQDQINFGDDLSDAFRDFANRIDTEDAHYLSVSIGIQNGTGGNLSRILSVLSQTIRDRYTMRKKIKAVSAEGRLIGIILTGLPVAIYLSIELATPSFYGDVRSDPLYPIFAAVIVGLTVMQGIILFRMVKFKF